MEIKDVKLVHYPEIKEGTLQDGLAVPSRPELYVFDVETTNRDGTLTVPNDPTNSDYWLVKEWYDAQETKPFEFNFQELAKPEFEETVYPNVEAEVEAQVSEPITAPEEPQTLLPK